MKVGALFAGYLGLDMAVQQVLPDAELAWVSEIDKGACKILDHRAPSVPNLGDITKVDWTQVEPVDILTGGSPCQDLSHAGKRAGMTEGTRSNLWVAMREAIAILRPSLVVWENVRGAYSAAADSAVESCAGCVGDGPAVHLRALGRVLGDLSDLGYDAQWHGLRAADVGAPHGRFRVFVAAYPDGGQQSRPALTGDGLSVAAERGLRTADLTLLPTPAVNDMGEGKTVEAWDEWTDAMKAKHGNGNGHGASLAIEAQRLLPTPVVTDVSGTRNKTAGRSADAKPFAVGTTLGDVTYENSWGQYADAITRWESLTRPAPDPTEPGPKGSPRLSARFSEWMMGLPDGWITDVPGITRNEALKAAGNGVVPQQAAAALRLMLARASEVAA